MQTFENIANFLSRTPVLIGMVVALLALIGLMVFLRMKKKDEDDDE